MRRKLEFWLDPALLHILWDPTRNQWKHLLGTKIEVEGTFVPSGNYPRRDDAWELTIPVRPYAGSQVKEREGLKKDLEGKRSSKDGTVEVKVVQFAFPRPAAK